MPSSSSSGPSAPNSTPAERAAQKGDYVKLALMQGTSSKASSFHRTELAPDKQLYGKVPQTWEEVEGSQEGHLPGLGRQLAGLKAGDRKSVPVAFPAEFPALPALAGKTADYALEILEVRERVVPPLDEAFFKAQQVDGIDALKDQVRANLKLQKEHMNRMGQRRQVTEALAAKIEFAVPQSLVETETQAVLRQIIEENMRRGVPEEQLQKDKKGLVDGARQAAEKRVKVQLMLARIAENEKIDITERDVENFIHREAGPLQPAPRKIREGARQGNRTGCGPCSSPSYSTRRLISSSKRLGWWSKPNLPPDK